jgi:hypothetical protein
MRLVDEASASDSGNDAERRRFWFGWLNDCVKQLRAELRVDEGACSLPGGRGPAPPPRLLALLDPGRRTEGGQGVLRRTELLGGEPTSSGDADEAQVERIVTEAILDEQSVWTRKLVEGLVTSICFGLTKGGGYYRHYVLLSEKQLARWGPDGDIRRSGTPLSYVR